MTTEETDRKSRHYKAFYALENALDDLRDVTLDDLREHELRVATGAITFGCWATAITKSKSEGSVS